MTDPKDPIRPNRWRAPDWPTSSTDHDATHDPSDNKHTSQHRSSGARKDAADSQAANVSTTRPALLTRIGEEFVAWIKTLASAAVYATLIVTFGFQVARVEGQSMAPTLIDQDRLIVNKLIYRLTEPHRSEIVMLYYPIDPDKSFVKRVIAEEGDAVEIDRGQVFLNNVSLPDEYVPQDYRSYDD